VTKIRDAFQGHPGAWLIPMDMAQLENYNNTGPTRMAYFVAVCKEKKTVRLCKIVKNYIRMQGWLIMLAE
jgi:hypothetical protein